MFYEVEKVYKDYNSADAAKEGKASLKRAMLFSIKKWEAMATIPADKLKDFWHTYCALCIWGDGKPCDRCPLGKTRECSLGAYAQAECAYGNWGLHQSTASFRRWRKAARNMLAVLERIYKELYPKG